MAGRRGQRRSAQVGQQRVCRPALAAATRALRSASRCTRSQQGGLRFREGVDLSVIKMLGFEQAGLLCFSDGICSAAAAAAAAGLLASWEPPAAAAHQSSKACRPHPRPARPSSPRCQMFKNALTTLPMGAAKARRCGLARLACLPCMESPAACRRCPPLGLCGCSPAAPLHVHHARRAARTGTQRVRRGAPAMPLLQPLLLALHMQATLSLTCRQERWRGAALLHELHDRVAPPHRPRRRHPRGCALPCCALLSCMRHDQTLAISACHLPLAPRLPNHRPPASPTLTNPLPHRPDRRHRRGGARDRAAVWCVQAHHWPLCGGAHGQRVRNTRGRRPWRCGGEAWSAAAAGWQRLGSAQQQAAVALFLTCRPTFGGSEVRPEGTGCAAAAAGAAAALC